MAELSTAVSRCGVSPDEVQISYEDYLQSEEIRVLSSSLSDEQIEILMAIQHSPPFPIVSFLSPDIFKRSLAIAGERYREESREWLRQRGLLDRLPVFESGKDEPMQFARRMEEFCGIKAGAALEWNDELKVVTPKLDWIAQPLRKGWLWTRSRQMKHQEQFECLRRAMSAANAEEHGIRFGFVGSVHISDERLD